MPGGQDALLAVLGRARELGFLGPGPLETHLDQAAAFLAAVPEPPARLLDLGAGGGVPGLVLAWQWPASEVVLLDAQAKRTAFLAGAVADLGLGARVSVVTARAEVAGRDPALRATFGLVTARSFGAPAVTAECGAPFLASGGRLVVAEPPDAPDARWPASGLGQLGLEDAGVVRRPGGTVRVLALVGAVPDTSPRRDGRPAKRPLF